jgi:DNA recombination protein RmuC
MTVLVLIIGLIAGIAVGWLLARRDRVGTPPVGTVTDMLGPLRDCMADVQRQLEVAALGRASSDSTLREQVRAITDTNELLRSQTARLVTALREPHVRGRWGELQLERVVEAAGMTEHVDYDVQVHNRGEDGAVRPDMVVHLAGGKSIVVDAKVALSAYLEALEAPDDATRAERLGAHARQLRSHIETLGGKRYWERFSPAPEFVVCFVPGDPMLDAALRADPALLEFAFARNVVIATPTTLVALLRTVAYTWRQEALTANLAQVRDLGQDLYRRLATLGGHFDRLGRSLSGAVGAYNEAVGSVESRVMSKARQFVDLGVVDPSNALASLQPLTGAIPRPLTAPEFGGIHVLPHQGHGADLAG